MNYRIISVGKIREPFYQDGIREYIKRLGAYTNIELLDGLEEKVSPRASEKDIQNLIQKEGEKVLKILGDNDILVVFDSQGKNFSSEQLADSINEWNLSGKYRVNLLIGGSHGLSEEIKKKAAKIISFSKMTFPHQMAVLILSEQIYRGFKILKGEPYHK